MNGFDVLNQLPSIGVEIGIALAGAAALWGAVFAVIARRKKIVGRGPWEFFTLQMFVPAIFGILFILIGWWSNSAVHPLLGFAQEGLNVDYVSSHKPAVLAAQFPLIILLIIVLFGGVFFIRKGKKNHLMRFEWFYLALLISILAFSLAPHVYVLGLVGLYEFATDVSRIMAFGTVAIVGHVYIRARTEQKLVNAIVPLLRSMSHVAWSGIGIQFLQALAVFDGALMLNDRFFFLQLVLGIILIVGAIVTGPLLRSLEHAVETGVRIGKTSEIFMLFLGAVGMISLFVLFGIDLMTLIPWNLSQLLVLYGSLIGLALFATMIAEYDR